MLDNVLVQLLIQQEYFVLPNSKEVRWGDRCSDGCKKHVMRSPCTLLCTVLFSPSICPHSRGLGSRGRWIGISGARGGLCNWFHQERSCKVQALRQQPVAEG